MEWVELTIETVLAHLPTDVKARYQAWIENNPGKENRLEEITANTLREFRDVIKSVPANSWHPDENFIPQSAVRHAENIIVFTLAMEMGLPITTAGTHAVTTANIYLRQIPYGRIKMRAEGQAAEGTPSYKIPTERKNRTLPMVALFFFLLISRAALGGWIDTGRHPYDTDVSVTFIPSEYSITTSSLFAHLQGINTALGKRVTQDYLNERLNDLTITNAVDAQARQAAYVADYKANLAADWANQRLPLAGGAMTGPITFPEVNYYGRIAIGRLTDREPQFFDIGDYAIDIFVESVGTKRPVIGFKDSVTKGVVRSSAELYFTNNTLVFPKTFKIGHVKTPTLTLGGETRTNWPEGTILGATINEPHTVATNDGILAFTVTADGSGFPLTNDVSAAGFAIEGMDKVVANSLYASNAASVRDLTVRRDITVLGDAECAGDLVVSGNLTLIGSATNLNWVVIDNRTNVYSGTNYIEKTVYSTQVLYSVTYAYTNIVTTNNVTTYVNHNGQWNATNAEYALFPHLRDYRDGNAEAIGTWDFSGANLVGLPTQGITNIGDGLTGDGLGTPLAVDWTDATTNEMTGISWESLGGLTQETDPIAIKPAQIGVGLLWTGTNLVATGEGTAIVTNEVDPRRYDAYREYATIDASTGTGTITSASALWLSLPASDEPRTLAMGEGFDAAQAWRFYVQIARGTNSLSIDTNLTGYAFLSLPVSSTNHVLIDRFPGDSNFRVIQVYR